jgi:hypothetical protein
LRELTLKISLARFLQPEQFGELCYLRSQAGEGGVLSRHLLL